MQGLGGVFLDHILYDQDAQMLNASLADYLVPLATDFSHVRAITMELRRSKTNPLGAKGAGEGDSGRSRTSMPSGLSAAATALAGAGRHRHHAALARALGAERIGLGAPQFHGDGADIGEVGRQRHEIIGERGIEHLRVAVVHDLVEEHAAEPLHQRADRLAVDDVRVDRDADVLDRDIVENIDVAGARIDRDMAGVRAVAVGPRRGREGAFHLETGEIR